MIRDPAWPVLLGLIAGLSDTYHATAIVATFLSKRLDTIRRHSSRVVALLGAAVVSSCGSGDQRCVALCSWATA